MGDLIFVSLYSILVIIIIIIITTITIIIIIIRLVIIIIIIIILGIGRMEKVLCPELGETEDHHTIKIFLNLSITYFFFCSSFFFQLRQKGL